MPLYTGDMDSRSGGLFDLITGLPAHPLVVHAVVIMIPLAVVMLIAALILPKARGVLRVLAVVFSFVGAASAWVAEQSGEALENRVGYPGEHAELGEIVTPLSVGLFLATLLWAVSSSAATPRWRLISRLLAVVALGVGVAAVVFTVLAGHSGAAATWEGRVVASGAPLATTSGVDSL